jgi:Holliday junction resolvase RusA-like endonuclease
VIRIEVPGEPKAMQTGSIRRLPDGRAFPARRHTEWGNRIALAAQAVRPPTLFEGPIIMKVGIVRSRPPSLPKRETWPIKRPDLDNYLKGLMDSLRGIIYRDDAQVVDLRVQKFYGPIPFLWIEVSVLGA